MRRLRLGLLSLATIALALGGFALTGCSDSNDDPYNPGPAPPTGFNSGTLGAGASYARTFSTAGTIGYHCNFHRTMGMTGTINVVSGGADSVLVTASGMVFSPASPSIKPGGTIRWSIIDGPHTVTQH